MHWLGRLFHRRKQDAQLDSELRFHIEQQTADNIAAGMNPHEARRRALAQFGGLESRKEECREARGTQFIDTLLQDIRFGLRMLRKSPGFTSVAILTLALGIGANTAIFSGLYGLVLSPLPYRNPSQLVMLWDSNRATGLKHIMVMEGSFPILRSQVKSFVGIAGFTYVAPRDQMPVSTVLGTNEPVSVGAVTPQFFSVMGVAPILGREFLPSEEVMTLSKEGWHISVQRAILSYAFWKEHYGASPDVIGKTLSLSELGAQTQCTIVGVMPKHFDFPYPLFPTKPDVWVNLAMPNWMFAPGNNFNVVGRLKPGVRIAQAEAEVRTIADRIRAQYPKYYKDEYVDVTPLRSELIRRAQNILWILLAAFGFILLIGCANVGNLLLVRAVSREREMAVRATLGASRAALIRQMLTEALLLAIGGGALGLLLAYWALHVFLALLPASIYIPRFDSVALDVRILVLAAILSVVVASVLGVLPSLRLARPNLDQTLKSGSFRRERPTRFVLRRAGSALLILEVSVVLVLLTGTLLMLRSMQKLLAVNSQYQPERLLSMRIDLSSPYWMKLPDNDVWPLYQQFEQRLAALPGVESVALAEAFPLPPHAHGSETFEADSGGGPISTTFQPAGMVIVTPAYFAMLNMNLVRGRWLADADGPKSLPVAVINEAMAKRYWPNADPLGVKIEPFSRFTMEEVAYTIVGVVQEPKRFGSGDTPEPTVYLDYSQVPLPGFTAIVRTAGIPQGIATALRSTVLKTVPGQVSVGNLKTGEELVSKETAMPRFTTQLLTAFASLALLLAVVGIFGLISYYASQRTHEIGIRMALGAQRADVMRLVLGEGMLLAGLGIAAGLVASYGFAKSLASFVYGISVTDFYSFTAAPVLLFGVALAACYIPARRAMRVDPMVALRYE